MILLKHRLMEKPISLLIFSLILSVNLFAQSVFPAGKNLTGLEIDFELTFGIR